VISPLLHCPPLPHGADISAPALSTFATSFRYVHFCIFHPRRFDRADLSTPANSINPRQVYINLSVQNAAARFIFNRRRDHITDALISIHWLRVPERIILKVATLTYRALHGSTPPYLASSFTFVADMPHRCGIACQAMLRRPHHCWCSKTG